MPTTESFIAGVHLVTQTRHDDHRGWFRQICVVPELEQSLGRGVEFRQSNHSRSLPGVLRGFHAEPWDKLVYVASGAVLAVLADIRPHSPTFGQHVRVELGEGRETTSVFVPDGVANSYCVVGDEPADYIYQVTSAWRPGVDKRAVRWDDPTLGVDWPLDDPVLSDDDRVAPTLREQFPDHAIFDGPERS